MSGSCEHEPILTESGEWVCRKCGVVLGYDVQLPSYRKTEPHFSFSKITLGDQLFIRISRYYISKALQDYGYGHCADKFDGDVKRVVECITASTSAYLSSALGVPVPAVLDAEKIYDYVASKMSGVHPINLKQFIAAYVAKAKMAIKRARAAVKRSAKTYEWLLSRTA